MSKTLFEKIVVMQAALEGEQIEWTTYNYQDWTVIDQKHDSDSWNWTMFDYRVRTPREMTVSEIEEALGYRIYVVC